MKSLFLLIVFVLIFSGEVMAQPTPETKELPDPKIAFLKSLAIPGWGHYYVDKSNWARGQYHLGAEAVLVLSYLGFSIHSNNLQQNWFAYGKTEAGVRVEGRNRTFQLAVGDFNSLEAYNDFQLRSRNWDELIADTPENRWQWSESRQRDRYNNLRSRFERIDQQLPGLLALMAVNRIIGGISAYNRAKKKIQFLESTSFSFTSNTFGSGVIGNVRVSF